MFGRYLNEELHIFNVSTDLSAYGYIYYASLYAGESYAIHVLLGLLAVIGIASTVFLFTIHLCAIFFAQLHLYRTAHLRTAPSVSRKKPYSERFHAICTWPIHAMGRGLWTTCHWVTCQKCANIPSVDPAKNTSSNQPKTIVKLPKLLENAVIPCLVTPGVSIIKPLAGLDINLECNLTSYFHLDYPVYEILFCVADASDPACELVQRLQNLYPHVSSRLVIAQKVVGVNPKVNNLQAGYELARYDLLLVSDSGIWMRPDTLSDMVAMLTADDKTGMVHQIPFMTPHITELDIPLLPSVTFSSLTSPVVSAPVMPTASRLLSKKYTHELAFLRHNIVKACARRPSFSWIVQLLFFGCWHAKIYLCAALFQVNCVTGMSCLMRKSVLEDVKGFKHFGRYLAEDFFLAKHISDQGWKLRLSHQPAWQNSPSPSIDQFLLRISRWSQLRMSMVFVVYLLEPFSRCFPNAVLGSFAFSHLFPNIIDPGVYFLCHVLLWFLLDYILLSLMYPPCFPLCITKLEYLVVWVFVELIAVPFHFSSVFKRELHWRNRRYLVRWGGISEQIEPVSVVNRHPSNNRTMDGTADTSCSSPQVLVCDRQTA